jgi:hypothetical protein
MITIIHLMLLLYTKKIAYNFVTTIGNTILKNGVAVCATGYDVPNNSWGFC